MSRLLSLVLPLSSVICLHAEPDPHTIDETVVEADRISGVLDTSEPERARIRDSAGLLERVPGAAVVRNGPLTGIVQLRGVSGDRVDVQVDGAKVTPACPNHMDPPLHYVNPSAIEDATLFRSVSPVRLGGDSLGGMLLVERQGGLFCDDGQPVHDGELGAYFDGRNDGFGASMRGRIGNRTSSAGYAGSYDQGDDYRFPGGRVRASEYETTEHHVFLQNRSDRGDFKLQLGLNDSQNVGTPTLPMDMIEDRGYFAGLGYEGDLAGLVTEAGLTWHSIDHRMDRYTLRPFIPGPPTTGGNPRVKADAESWDLGGHLRFEKAFGAAESHRLRWGTDFHLAHLDARQENIDTGLTQDTFNDSSRDRVGFYGEWEWQAAPEVTTLLGIRNDTVFTDSGAIHRTMNPMAAADAAVFNAADRSETFVNWDVMAQVRWEPDSTTAITFGLARKSRAPQFVELFNYTPAQSTAGLSDGRTYLGNLGLDSEVAYNIELGAELTGESWRLWASPYYSYVDGFIQGAPTNRTFGGQPVLQFQNLDSELYGVDVEASWQCDDHFELGGTLSYVRGRNKDTGDNLYRIMPLHGSIWLAHTDGGWSNRVELDMVDDQDDTADYNGEQSTSGYTLLNLRSSYQFENGLTLSLGIDNVFDRSYEEHLNGINRVPGSDVARGDRIPAPGRFLYVGSMWSF